MFFTSEKWSYGKPRHPWRENWQAAFLSFEDVGKVCGRRFGRQFYCRTWKQSHIAKKQRDVKLLQTFLGTRNELRKVEEIPALELNEYQSHNEVYGVRHQGPKKGWDPGSQPRDLGSQPPGLGSAVFFSGSRIRRSGSTKFCGIRVKVLITFETRDKKFG